jgi:putative component of membrane protein insertase Oxa1/YidC/SpoIIIJ protein YidD
MKRIVAGLIRTYQLVLSPFVGQSCRFHPPAPNMPATDSVHGSGEEVAAHGLRVIAGTPPDMTRCPRQ